MYLVLVVVDLFACCQFVASLSLGLILPPLSLLLFGRKVTLL